MHIRRVANQLADLFARHGLTAEADAAVTGRTRTTYRFPVVVRSGPPVLVDGDLESDCVDDGTVLRLYLAATDVGGKALFVHSGTVPASAREYCGDRVTLWSKDEIVHLLGLTAWNSALGLPLPALPIAAVAPAPAVPVPVPTAATPTAPAPLSVPVLASTPLAAPPIDPQPAAPLPAAAVVSPMAALMPTVAELSALLDPVEATPATEAPTERFVDLEDARPVMDLETGAEVQVTTLPKTESDELATAEPYAMPEATLASEPAPTTVKEALPVAFRVAKPATSSTAAATASSEPPLFEMPPAFRPIPGEGAPLPVPDGSNGLLPARLTLDEARRSVSDRLFGIEEWELILQPVHLFDYAIDLLKEGSLNVDTQRGRIQVNGTDRKVTPTDAAAMAPPSRVFATPELVVMDKVLRVSPERAEQVARTWATELHGKTVHVPMSGADDGFDLTERRTIGPTSGQVTLKPLGVWHRPFWRLWGSNGHVDLDAVEGQVLDEEIKTADPDCLVVE